MVNSLTHNFSGLYMRGLSSQSANSQGSSSNSDDIPLNTGETITRLSNMGSTLSLPF